MAAIPSTYVEALAMGATLITLLSYFMASHICWQVHKHRNSRVSISNLPLVTGLISTALWTCFGVLKADTVMIVTFGIGFSLFLGYNLYYLIAQASDEQKKHRLPLIIGELVAAGLLIATLVVLATNALQLTSNEEGQRATLLMVVGFACVIAQIAYFASPLASLPSVLKRRSSEMMPLPLIVAFVLVSLLWLLYGIAKDDVWMMITNAVGLLLSLCALAVFIAYAMNRHGNIHESSFKKVELINTHEPIIQHPQEVRLIHEHKEINTVMKA